MEWLGGFLGGLTGATITYPLDSYKTFLQLGIRPRTWFTGLAPHAMISAMQQGIKFGTFDQIPTHVDPFMKGCMAGALQGVFTGPVEQFKVMKQTGAQFSVKKMNPHGLITCIARDSLFAGLLFSSNAFFVVKFGSSPVSSVLSGMGSSIITTPIDITRANAQNFGLSVKDAIQEVFRTRGALGFFTGGFLRSVRFGVQFGICFEVVKAFKTQDVSVSFHFPGSRGL